MPISPEARSAASERIPASGRHGFSYDRYGKVLAENSLIRKYDDKQRLSEFRFGTMQCSYICFAADEIRCVRRITEAADTITIEFAMGRWEDRAVLNYQPINTVYNLDGTNYDSYGRPEGHRYYNVKKERLTPYIIEENPATAAISTQYYYGEDGRLERLKTGESTLTYSYQEGTGQIEQAAWSHGITLDYSYDQYRRLTEIKLNGTPVTGYELNNDDQRTQTTLADTTAWSYTYDALGQLKTAKRGTANTMSYNYDGIGNRKTAAEDGIATAYTANQLNQYTRINAEEPTYDADGNMLSWNGWAYTWNNEKRLIRAEKGTIRFEADYDYMGRRYVKKVYQNGMLTKHQRFTYDGYKLIAIHDAVNNRQEATFQWQPIGLDTPLTMTRNGEMFYYITEGNKNVIKLLRADGTEAANYAYAPFGGILSQSGDMAEQNPFRFSSEYHDDEIELVYYNYRYYNPVLGRWTKRDPIGEKDRVDMYAIVSNSIVNHSDILGLLYIDMSSPFEPELFDTPFQNNSGTHSTSRSSESIKGPIEDMIREAILKPLLRELNRWEQEQLPIMINSFKLLCPASCCMNRAKQAIYKAECDSVAEHLGRRVISETKKIIKKEIESSFFWPAPFILGNIQETYTKSGLKCHDWQSAIETAVQQNQKTNDGKQVFYFKTVLGGSFIKSESVLTHVWVTVWGPCSREIDEHTGDFDIDFWPSGGRANDFRVSPGLWKRTSTL